MTNSNGFSDSQESFLLNAEEMEHITEEITPYVSDPFSTENILEVLDGKYMNLSQHASEGTQIKVETQEQYFQESEISTPVKEEFPGPYNFLVQLGNQDSCKHWVYSQTLRKVFINMEETLPLRFKWEPAIDGLFLRTSMVFSLDQYASDPVKRCHNHMAMNNMENRDIDPIIIKHVVRCLDHSSMYEEHNEHLSVLTPLHTPQAGSQYVLMNFKFLCKNSCPSGMNRRPTELIFTLEDGEKRVLGRRRLPVRVCSCPKRDKKKEEGEVGNTQSAKKRKLCMPVATKLTPSCDTHVFNIQMNVVGKENYLAVLKYAYDIMAGQAARTGQFEFFKPYMDDILRKTP